MAKTNTIASVRFLGAWLTLFSLSTFWLECDVALAISFQQDQMATINPDIPPPFPIDPQRVSDHGIRIFRGKHLVLYSDLEDEQRLKQLIAAFDQAVPAWCQLFDVPVAKAQAWQMRGYLIANPGTMTRFQQANLTPGVPAFDAGFQQNYDFWLFAQPGKYYTRHLMLHEGTHAFMQWFTGGYGAPWYSEGMAELTGLHRWDPNSKPPLTLKYRLWDKSEAEYWGRVKRIRTDIAEQKAMTLDDVLNIPPREFRGTRNYAWSWAACEFFSRHEATQKLFAQLIGHTRKPPAEFNQTFKTMLKEANVSWPLLADHWELFLDEIDYGFLVERSIPKAAIAQNVESFAIRSDHSWQITRQVKQGERWEIKARGKILLGNLIVPVRAQNEIKQQRFSLNSGPTGITAYHYQGRPLGELQAGVWALEQENSLSRTRGLRMPIPVGASQIVQIEQTGVLCLRINESPAKLADNQHALEVTLRRLE